jgi:hypothetical protein
VVVELLVNCRNANWCPAAPEPRSARMVRAEVGQPPRSMLGAGVGVGVGVALAELDGAGVLTGAELELALVAGVLETGAGAVLLAAGLELGGMDGVTAVLDPVADFWVHAARASTATAARAQR